MLSGEKILITGASGLVGMQLSRALVENNEVWGVSRYVQAADRVGAINSWATGRDQVEGLGLKTFAADLGGDLSGLPDDFTYVLHFAHTRLGAERLSEAVTINSINAGRVMYHCRKAKAALIMSSSAVYSFPVDPWRPIQEGDSLGRVGRPSLKTTSPSDIQASIEDAALWKNPTSPVAKISMEGVAQFCANQFGLRTIIMRANVVYGPRGGMPVREMDKIVNGETIDRFCDPYPHSPIHFDDMVDQLESLFDAASTKALIVNWGGDEVVTQRDWCEQASALCGHPFNATQVDGAPGNIADPTRRKSITGPCKRMFKESYAEIYRIRHGEKQDARKNH